MTAQARNWLTLAAGMSFGVALLHAAIIFVGPAAYTYFGAGDLAPLAARGSPLPALLTAVLAALFAVTGLYALSGARRMPRLPFLTPALGVIATVYVLRGLALVPEFGQLARGTASFPPRYAVFSAVSLIMGVAYAAGTLRLRRSAP